MEAFVAMPTRLIVRRQDCPKNHLLFRFGQSTTKCDSPPGWNEPCLNASGYHEHQTGRLRAQISMSRG